MRLGQVTLHFRHVTCAGLAVWLLNSGGLLLAQNLESRPRILIETDAGGDPDDEQSLVRFLMYANEFDVEGIIANRKEAREGENKNPVRDGLGIVQATVRAYGECHPNLVVHDPRFPSVEALLRTCVPGYQDTDDGVNLIISAVDKDDRRPVWFSNWGTDRGSAESCLKRALDKVLKERGQEGYAKFKNKLRLSSADRFAEHTATLNPAFRRWIDTSQPEQEGKRWYHQFSRITARAGGFDIQRDVIQDHGPLGRLYPTNTSLPQKEGDTSLFLYLVPNGLSDPNEPGWGGWGGRLGQNPNHPDKAYFWANVKDTWQGSTHRDQTLVRWAADLQNDFKARMDWCVADAYDKANHAPIPVLNGNEGKGVMHLVVRVGDKVELSATGTRDPDGQPLHMEWMVYPEAGTFRGEVALSTTEGGQTGFIAPKPDQKGACKIHVVLRVQDQGTPPLCAYRRAVIVVETPPAPAADVFPGSEWDRATPESQGLHGERLTEAVRYLESSLGQDGVREVVIVRHGKMVWKGDDIDKVHGTWSLTKSFTSTVMGVLVDDGKCTPDTRVAEVLPEMAALYPELTLRHFTTMTSGYRAQGDETTGSYKHGPSKTPFIQGEPLFRPPGGQFAYWDSAMNQYGNVLTRIAGEPMAEVFQRRIAGPIGMRPDRWKWGNLGQEGGILVNCGSGNRGQSVQISAGDLARLGWLMRNGGRWGDRQLLSERWVNEATRVQVPAALPWGHPEGSADGRGCYGYNWWVNGVQADGSLKFPHAPVGVYCAAGHNNNRCFVIPQWDMVIVRLGLDGDSSDMVWSDFLGRVAEAVER